MAALKTGSGICEAGLRFRNRDRGIDGVPCPPFNGTPEAKWASPLGSRLLAIYLRAIRSPSPFFSQSLLLPAQGGEQLSSLRRRQPAVRRAGKGFDRVFVVPEGREGLAFVIAVVKTLVGSVGEQSEILVAGGWQAHVRDRKNETNAGVIGPPLVDEGTTRGTNALIRPTSRSLRRGC